MAKEMTDAELEKHINEATDKLNKVMMELKDCGNDNERSKTIKLAYWVKSFANYTKGEHGFIPTSRPKYKYGEIVQVDFGFRIGSEIGGLRYAVVIDKDNDQHSPTVTVVPLSSKKATTKPTKYNLELSKGVFSRYTTVLIDKINEASAEIEDAKKLSMGITEEMTEEEKSLIVETAKKKEKEALDILNTAKGEITAFNKFKKGTIAKVEQVTTISKMRIIRPQKKSDWFTKCRLPEDEMNRIKDTFNSFFF